KAVPFAKKSVVITGASLGIGRAIALQLAGEGAWLTLAARHEAELEQVARKCRDGGGRCIAVRMDVSREAQCERLVDRAAREYGSIDVLILNAGIGMHGDFDQLPDLSLLKTLMDVNYWGSVYCAFRALPHLKAARGRIVVVSSGGGKLPTPGVSGYASSKWALSGFSDTLRIELAASGVTVTVAYPEWVATGISSRALMPDGRLQGKVVSHEVGAMSADECARRILHAAARRKRDVMSPRLRLGLVLAPILPGLLDKIAAAQYA
ncbi:MAG: SDR family oxidoreductase, partial [Anaerolineales bacterium]